MTQREKLRRKADEKLLEYKAEQVRFEAGRFTKAKWSAVKKASRAYERAEEKWWESLTEAEQLAQDPERVKEEEEFAKYCEETTSRWEREQRNTPASQAERVLGIPHGASDEVIKAAYRALAKRHHPDCGGDAEKMAEINIAYEVLTA